MSTSYDPTDVQTQERKASERELRERNAAKNEEADLKWLMGSRRGRRIVGRLLEQSGVYRLSFNTNSMQMAFAECNRNYGNRMLAMLHAHCPELYMQLIKEQSNGIADDGHSRNDH